MTLPEHKMAWVADNQGPHPLQIAEFAKISCEKVNINRSVQSYKWKL